MKLKEIIYVSILFILMFVVVRNSVADDYIIDINSTGDIDLHLNFSINPQENHYYSEYNYGDGYNDWDMYEGSESAIKKAFNNELDNVYEYGYINSLYNFIMMVFNPYRLRIEKLEKENRDYEERIYSLQKRMYVIETKLTNSTI